MIKRPTWKWYIPLYFFIGGVAGGAAFLGGMAQLFGGEHHRATVRHARWIALIGALLSPLLLIADLGRRGRFHHMLRILKFSSPMSVGTWILTTSGMISGVAAVKQAAEDDFILPRQSRIGRLARAVPNGPLSLLQAVFGLGLGGYTGVLVAVTAVPLWFAGVLLLGPLFLATSLASGASLLALLALFRRHKATAVTAASDEQARAEVEQVATVAAAAQLGLSVARELATPQQVARPLRTGLWGAIYQVSAVGAGMLAPLALRLPAQVRGRAVGRSISAAAATLSLVGALAERFAIVEAGKQSADDPLAYQEMTKSKPGEARPTATQQAQRANIHEGFEPGQVVQDRFVR
jgi:formate-dependent nitrite reductase membrane component NrfD